MTSRTSSATRRSVVSRSSVVLTTSATLRRRRSPSLARSIWEVVVAFTGFIITADSSGDSKRTGLGTSARASRPRNRRQGTGCRVEAQMIASFDTRLRVLDHADIRQIAVFFGIVQTVANNVSIGDREADVLRFYRLLTARRFVEQSGNAQGSWLMRLY